MAAPTSALTFQELIIDVAKFLGTAYYGAGGDEAPQVPTQAHDLAEAKDYVNKGIRKFIADAPPTGWRWIRGPKEITSFATVAASSAATASGGAYDAGNDRTLITVTGSTPFVATMEYKTINFATSGDFTVETYVTSATAYVTGDASAVSGEQFSITSDGNFTLPADFVGMYTGVPTFPSDTNRGLSLEWRDEGMIRQWRENVTDETGDPFWVAVRPMTSPAAAVTARRWEMLLYPKPDEALTVIFPYDSHFDSLVELTDTPPSPIPHDHTIRMYCLAAAEAEDTDMASTYWQDLSRTALQTSMQIDNRTGPRKLGYFGNPSTPTGSPIENFRRWMYDRPSVNVNP